MKIWVDADACPNAIKEILFRAARRTGIALILVSNQPVRVPPDRAIRNVQVPAGFDVADNWIVEQVGAGDLVITADIPLAAEVVARNAFALNPRGEFYTEANIDTGGPAAFGPRDRQAFANQLDRFLARYPRVQRDPDPSA